MGNRQSHQAPDPYKFYWSGKRKLYPNWEAVKRIDELVSQIPGNMRGKPSKLVPLLVSHCSNEAEQFRAIFRWVTENIKYDVNALNTGTARRYSINRSLGPNSWDQVLERGVAVCAGYCNLLVELCEKAGIEVIYIGGMAKTDKYAPGDPIDLDRDQGHAWIAVKLGGVSYLCDPTWAAGSTDGSEGSKRFTARWDESWFITEPYQFLESHWPRGVGNVGARGDVHPELQYVKKPMTQFDAWCRLPIRKGNSGRYPMLVTPLSHKVGLIETSDNSAEITFQYDRTPLSVQASITNLNSQQQLEGFAKVVHYKNTYKVVVRVPTKNSSGYLLSVAAKPFYTSTDEILTNVLEYKIQPTGDMRRDPFPGDTAIPFIGPSQNFHDCGLETDVPYQTKCKNGAMKVTYKLHKTLDKRRNIMGKLVFRGGTDNLKDQFCLGSVGSDLKAELRLQREGEYLFSLLVQSLEDPEMYYYICSHVIVNEKSCGMDPFPGRERPYGITTHFLKNKYTLHSPNSHILTTKNGRCFIEMTIPKDRKVAFCLRRKGSKYAASEESIYAEQVGSRVRFNIQLRETGYFAFAINEINGDEAGEWLACFLIHCQQPADGAPYPEYSFIWGQSEEFKSSRSSLLRQKTSTISTKKGGCKLIMKNFFQLSELTFKLNGKRNRDCSQNVLAESKGAYITFYFRFLETGNYRFSLHQLSSRGTWKNCLLNIMVQAKDTMNGELFPVKPRLIGEHPGMSELSLSVTSTKSALITTKTGRCVLVLRGKLPVQLFHSLTSGVDDMTDHVCCETNGEQGKPELKYLFELPKVGIYTFLIHTGADKGGDVYSAQIHCTKTSEFKPFFTAKPVPNYQLGLVHGNSAEIQLAQSRSSTIRLVNGTGKLLLKIGNENVEKLMAWYHCTNNDDRRELGHHVLIERKGAVAEVTVAPPEPKRYLIVLAAKMKGSENLVKVGTFLIEPGEKVVKYNGFPIRYQPFYSTEGTRFYGPFRTTLEREREYDVEIFIPEATRVVVGGTVLSSRSRSHAHKGRVKVKQADKALTVSAVFKTGGTEEVIHYLKFNVTNKTKDQFVTASKSKK